MTTDDLRRWQAEMGYTQDQAAAALSTPVSTYKRWLSGVNPNTGAPIELPPLLGLACAALLRGVKPYA